MADRTGGGKRRDERLSGDELEFRRRWRLMIDRLGGQRQAVAKMDWSSSTVSRDCQGITLPSSTRLAELCNRLEIDGAGRAELEILLRRAMEARQARRNGDSAVPGDQTPAGSSPEPGRRHGGRSPYGPWIIATAAAVVAVAAAITVGVAVLSPRTSPPTARAGPRVRGSFPGTGVKAVPVPVRSLTPTLRAQFDRGRTRSAKTVTGYEFRNARSPSQCLTAADTGPRAGRPRDPVEIADCALSANQIWIPEQWDIDGMPYTHLVSDRYPTMCLNARKIGGAPTGPGNAIMLWRCYYPAGNEAWAFGDWYAHVAPGHRSYPLSLSNARRYCIDADRRFGVPAGVRLWTHQAIAGQFWS